MQRYLAKPIESLETFLTAYNNAARIVFYSHTLFMALQEHTRELSEA